MAQNKPPSMEGYYYHQDGSIIVDEQDDRVLLKNAIVIRQGGKEYYLDAEFDLSDLPQELHEIAVQMMNASRQKVYI